jgi:hypothetical protein
MQPVQDRIELFRALEVREISERAQHVTVDPRYSSESESGYSFYSLVD